MEKDNSNIKVVKTEKKAANGNGSLRKNKNGKFELTITIGTNPNTGKSIRKSFSGKTIKEVNRRRDEYISSKISGTYIEPNRLKLGEWLSTWLNTYKKDQLSPKTFDRYESILNLHIIPSLGTIRMQQLKSEDIQNLYNSKKETGRCDASGGLSASSIRYIHIILKQALEKAKELDYINKNPAIYCVLPKMTKSNVKALAPEDMTKIINTLDKGNTYDLLILTDLLTGLRQGELLALNWSDIDFENNNINVNKSLSIIKNRDENKTTKFTQVIKDPKTESSKRIVPLPESIVPILKKHKTKMAENNLAAGRNNNNYNLVFPSSNGTPLTPSNVRRHWINVLDKVGIDHVKFHTLRHNYASILIEHEADMKSVQELLGHKDISTTMNIYVHTNEQQKKRVVSKIDDLIKDEIREEYETYKICS